MSEVDKRLQEFVGTNGLLLFRQPGGHALELKYTVIAVTPAKDEYDNFEQSINFSDFNIRFDNDIMIDGSAEMTIPGYRFLPTSSY